MEPAKADARQKITIDVAAAIFKMFFFFVEIRIKSQRPFAATGYLFSELQTL